ncbi:DUF1566 domain-containing protein [Undibacterium sp. FT147W]|uniref:DUF1566 domain-containing protein n=1 Tax=Undibacterium rivi TaxID=2828729 RepID=A0ABS5H0V3_9BURK|nr:DUF1566 domain-containing protein [Undibacterium rivi]MBR7792342.1 DUF1566 domain-containing protein [Undibacterium rivi]
MSKAQFLAERQRPGEIYAGLILGKNGQPDYHLFLLEAKPKALLDWADSKKWAASVGGELPNRCEQSLLFANRQEHFEKDWYWSSEQNARNDDYAWVQSFGSGLQSSGRKSGKYRARAVRRELII